MTPEFLIWVFLVLCSVIVVIITIHFINKDDKEINVILKPTENSSELIDSPKVSYSEDGFTVKSTPRFVRVDLESKIEKETNFTEIKVKEIKNKLKEKNMTITQFQSKIAKREGKKSQVKIGDVREVLKLVNLEISRVSKEDLESIIKNARGQNVRDLLYKIVKKL